jgi:hypothetical protein
MSYEKKLGSRPQTLNPTATAATAAVQMTHNTAQNGQTAANITSYLNNLETANTSRRPWHGNKIVL